jgi:3-hydroxyisobutyrate dehydrogenase-like beta-hydroxyacid dehydrogenase
MQKDIVLALEAARELRVPLPSPAVADEMLTLASAHGHEHDDLAALFSALRQLVGEPLRAAR